MGEGIQKVSELALLIQSSNHQIQIQKPEIVELVEAYCNDPDILDIDPFECSISIELLSGFTIHIDLEKSYPNTRPLVSIEGVGDRAQHETINKDIHDFLSGCPAGEPLLDALIDFIQDALLANRIGCATDGRKRLDSEVQSPKGSCADEPITNGSLRRILFWSHHLLAISKRKQLRDQASVQDINIITRVGYPGYIAAEGRPQDVQSFVQEVKSWRWAAIQLKFDMIETVVSDSSWKRHATLKSQFYETESLSDFANAIAQIPRWKKSILH